MKKAVWKLVTWIVLAGCFASYGNVISNKSFENGQNNWTWGESMAVVVTNPPAAYDQAAYLQINQNTLPISQTIPLDIGATYTVSVWINAASLTGGNVVFDTSDVYDLEGCQFSIVGNSGWQEYTGSFVATGSNVTFRVFSDAAGFAGVAYVDLITVVRTADPVITSIPATEAGKDKSLFAKIFRF